MARKKVNWTLVGAAAVGLGTYLWATGRLHLPISPGILGTPGTPPQGAPIPPEAAQAVAAAKGDLVTVVGLVPIAVVGVQGVTWGDTSMSCPVGQFTFSATYVPGWIISLSANGRTFTYHTNQDGSRLCRLP